MSLPGGSEASPDHAGLRGTRTMRYDHPGYPVRSSRGVLPPGLARRHAAFSAARAAGTLERMTRAVRRRGPPVGSEPRAALVCPGVSPCVNRRDLRRAASFAFWVGTASCSPVTKPVRGLVRARRRLLTNTARNARRSVTCSSATGFVTSARARHLGEGVRRGADHWKAIRRLALLAIAGHGLAAPASPRACRRGWQHSMSDGRCDNRRGLSACRRRYVLRSPGSLHDCSILPREGVDGRPHRWCDSHQTLSYRGPCMVHESNSSACAALAGAFVEARRACEWLSQPASRKAGRCVLPARRTHGSVATPDAEDGVPPGQPLWSPP